MQRNAFLSYLIEIRKLNPSTARSRVGNCSTIETYEGNLDEQFDKDGLKSLKKRLGYSKHDQRTGAPAKHSIPIDGDIYNGTATLRSALNLYIAFKYGNDIPTDWVPGTHPTSSQPRQRRGATKSWPIWDQPNEKDSLALAKMVAKYIKFLSPEIIEAVTQDNIKRRDEWSEGLQACGINPALYIWEGSPCAFPGVRRYAGSKEIQNFRDSDSGRLDISDALCLDDNDYPKQIWSFVFRNAQFSKFGPDGYRLAHLVDHKEYNNRMNEELDCELGECPSFIPGLYTCPSNTAYVSGGLLLPTDFNDNIRNLLQRRAMQLYGSVCNMLPAGLKVKTNQSADWELDEFEWAPCVGTLEYMEAFFNFREKRMEKLFTQNLAGI